MSPIDVLRKLRDCFGTITALIIARMNVVQFDPQSFATFQVVEIGCISLIDSSFFCMSKVDKIRAMRYDVVRLGVLMFSAVVVEGIGMEVGEVGICPLSLRFEKEGEGIGSDMDAVQNGVVDAYVYM